MSDIMKTVLAVLWTFAITVAWAQPRNARECFVLMAFLAVIQVFAWMDHNYARLAMALRIFREEGQR